MTSGVCDGGGISGVGSEDGGCVRYSCQVIVLILQKMCTANILSSNTEAYGRRLKFGFSKVSFKAKR